MKDMALLVRDIWSINSMGCRSRELLQHMVHCWKHKDKESRSVSLQKTFLEQIEYHPRKGAHRFVAIKRDSIYDGMKASLERGNTKAHR